MEKHMNDEFNLTTTCTKEEFAKIVNCDIAFLERLINLTDIFPSAITLKNLVKTHFLAKITCGCSCGQFYEIEKDENSGIWLGAHFPMHSKPKLILGLYLKNNNQNDELLKFLIEGKYTFTYEYDPIEEYWLSIELKNSIHFQSDSISTTIREAKILIAKFFETKKITGKKGEPE